MDAKPRRSKGPKAHLVRSETRRVSELPLATREQMFRLFERYFHVDRATFDADLDEKSHVFLLFDKSDGALAGFSTIMPYDIELDGVRHRALHGGDTLVDAPYWGSPNLDIEYAKFMLRYKLAAPLRPLYWFNMTQGYKTYLKIARTFPTHWPRPDKPTPPLEQALMNAYARKKFGKQFLEKEGIVRFEHDGRLKAEVAPITEDLLRIPDVAFFVEKNPRHAEGDELLGIVQIDLKMFRALITKLLRA